MDAHLARTHSGDMESTEHRSIDMTATTTQDRPAAEVGAESRNWATLTHLSAFVLFFGIPSFVGPLVAWVVKKDDPYVADQAKEALNFNLSFLIYALVAGFSIIVAIGILLLPAVLITWFALVIVATIRASQGETYRYPFSLRLIR